jgi:hypothetical protein
LLTRIINEDAKINKKYYWESNFTVKFGKDGFMGKRRTQHLILEIKLYIIYLFSHGGTKARDMGAEVLFFNGANWGIKKVL